VHERRLEETLDEVEDGEIAVRPAGRQRGARLSLSKAKHARPVNPVRGRDVTYTWRVDKSYLPQRRNENCKKSGLRKIGPACPRQLISSRDASGAEGARGHLVERLGGELTYSQR
jgi:hypothetical protein